MSRPIRLAVFLTLAAGACRPSAAGDLPRYALRPGQILSYESAMPFPYEGGTFHFRTSWTIWVVGRNDDGGWRLIARTSSTSGQHREGQKEAEEEPRVAFARFDLSPEGVIPPCPTLGTRMVPSDIFPRLPGDARALADGWATEDPRDETAVRYRPRPGDDDKVFTFEAVRDSFFERIYEGREDKVYRFDEGRGLVTRVDETSAQGFGFKGKGVGTTELKEVAALEPGVLATFAAEMDRFFAAHQGYLDLLRKSARSGQEAGGLLDRGRSLLAEARAAVTLPGPRQALDDQLANHDKFGKSYRDEAARFAEVLGRPSPDWEAKDLDGRPRKLADFRGRVVVLDFWYRGCGWCMRAMPQVKAVAREFADRPVAILGMCTDREEADARFVVERMRLDYPTIRAEGIPAKYGVNGFPTLVILDQDGKVADIHVGYSPTLREDVSRAVRELLARE